VVTLLVDDLDLDDDANTTEQVLLDLEDTTRGLGFKLDTGA
jgi:hypothetical protein